MFSMFPLTAVKLIIILIITAVIVGLLINLFEKKRQSAEIEKIGFSVHKELKSECLSIKKESIYYNLRFISFKRAILLVSLIIFIIGLILGEFGNFAFRRGK